MPGSAPQRPTVLVFATGGTVGMHETDRGLAPDPDFPEALERLVDGVCSPLRIDARINHLLPAIDSANADAETAPRIARAIRARVRTHRPRGVVILHGTDTLVHTAARLAFELAAVGSPVILTGSQLPHGAQDGDAADNLSLAIRAAVRAAPGAPVSIAFGGELLPAVRAAKFDTVARTAFRAERPLAPSPAGTPRDPAPEDAPAAPARVITFRFTPATTAEDLRTSVGGRPDGLVLECYGTGNAPVSRPGMLGTLRELSAAIPVLAITQCALGGVDLTRYAVGRELEAAGVIDGGDLTLEAATAKLGYLLDHGHRGEGLRAALRANLVGERAAGD